MLSSLEPIVSNVRVSPGGLTNLDLEKSKAEIYDYGFTVIPNAVPREEADRAAKRIVEIMSKQPETGKPDQHISDFVDHLEPEEYPLFAKFLANPACLEVAESLVGDNMQLAEPGCRWNKPGSPVGPLHIGVPVDAFVKSGFPVPNVCLVVGFSWMLNDLTADMGATFYLPFSHWAPRTPKPGADYKYAIGVEGTAGTVVLYQSGIWHGFGANTTRDKSRIGLMAGYASALLDVETAGFGLMKKPVRDRMPEAIQKLNRRIAKD